MTTPFHLLSKTGIFDPLFQYFTTIHNCDYKPECPQAQQYAMCKFASNKTIGCQDTDISDEFTRNVLAFGKNLQNFDIPTYQGSLIKPIEEKLFIIIRNGIENAILYLDSKSEPETITDASIIPINSNGRIKISIDTITKIENLFNDTIIKNVDLNDKQKIVLENLKKILVQYFQQPLVIFSNSSTHKISDTIYNIELSNMIQVIYGKLTEKISKLSDLGGPLGPLYVLRIDKEVNYTELLIKMNISNRILNEVWVNLFRKPVGRIFDRPSITTTQKTKDALKLLNRDEVDGVEKILFDRYMAILNTDGIKKNISEIDVDKDRINLKQELLEIEKDKIIRIPTILKLLPILSEETKAIIVNGKRVETNDKYILIRMAAYANRKDVDRIEQINKLLGREIVKSGDPWNTITDMNKLVFDIDMGKYITQQLERIDDEESELDGSTIEELSNKFRKIGERYEINRNGKWEVLDNKYIIGAPKCFSTGIEVDKSECKDFIFKLLDGNIEPNILNSIGKVSMDDIKGIHPKLAIKLLKQLGFRKVLSKKSNLWMIQSVEYVLNRHGTKLNEMREFLNTDAINYISLLVKLINSNDIYNIRDKIEEKELTVSAEPLPEIIQRMNIRRHTPYNTKNMNNFNWEILSKDPVTQFALPSLNNSFSLLGLTTAPLIRGGALNNEINKNMIGGSIELKGYYSSSIYNICLSFLTELMDKKQINRDELHEFVHKLKRFDDLEYEMYKTLRTYGRFEFLLNSGFDTPLGHKTQEHMKEIINKWKKLSSSYNEQTSTITKLMNKIQNELNIESEL